MRQIKAIMYGVGNMGKIMTRLMVEKGITIVGAIDVRDIGKDLREVVELGYPLNVKISDDADAVLKEQEADIAVVALFDDLERMYPMFKNCIENDLNVITIGSEASYSWISSPELTAKLDRLAKKHSVTITGSGNHDIYMVNAGILMTGASHKIESISYRNLSNSELFGPAVAEAVYIGETKEKFYKKIKQKPPICYGLYFLSNVVAGLGLGFKYYEIETEPVIAERDMESKVLGKTIKKGLVAGTHQKIEIDTEQGVKLYGDYTLKMFRENETEEKEWYIKGTPDLSVKFGNISTDITSCTQMVHRIPDVISSEPGYITIEKLPMLKFRPFPLNFYICNE